MAVKLILQEKIISTVKWVLFGTNDKTKTDSKNTNHLYYRLYILLMLLGASFRTVWSKTGTGFKFQVKFLNFAEYEITMKVPIKIRFYLHTWVTSLQIVTSYQITDVASCTTSFFHFWNIVNIVYIDIQQ